MGSLQKSRISGYYAIVGFHTTNVTTHKIAIRIEAVISSKIMTVFKWTLI